ncbi:UDP-N-acetylglucosamine 2-epimerase [Polaribacter sp.]|uniref:UDP-N-acetylglucosamine 2-epimerase n=1 Tax=Polaribacter sp. TaxID=1920175 RepID=UPI004048AA0C
MRIGVLTSSRADYGIYLPLLKKLKLDSFFDLEIIAFGTHLSKFHGFTISQIENDGYAKIHKISSLLSNDDEQAIATAYGLTVLKFADFWSQNNFDLVFCLGDRFEMSAAVQAGIPYRVKFAHIHGGETTLGAIDNIYRHQITLASNIHFTASSLYADKITSLTEDTSSVHAVGALSLDEIMSFKPIEKELFYKKFELPTEDFALLTFHPETLAVQENRYFAEQMKTALSVLLEKIFLVITMPNADTLGTIYREQLEKLKRAFPTRVLLIENFGKVNYFSAMHYAKFLIGNTSSGIIEAASFGKYVVNVGDRQKGRAQSKNILDANFNANEIITKSNHVLQLGEFTGENIYYIEGAADNIVKIIKKI